MNDHNGKGFQLDIRDSISLLFDDEEDFERTISLISEVELMYENDKNKLYKLSLPIHVANLLYAKTCNVY